MKTEKQLRTELAAAFRWAARLDFHEATANHFSLAVNESGSQFLMNSFMTHFSRIKASDLILLDVDDESSLATAGAPDPTAWHLHAYLHKHVPRARCILHTHMPWATALSSLADPTLLPICQNTARFYDNVAYDTDFRGMFLHEDESARVAALLGDKDVMLLGNHGVMVVGDSVAYAFDTLYYFERAAMNLMMAYSANRPIKQLSEEVAALTRKQWDGYFPGFSDGHFAALMEILDDEAPCYKD